MLSLYHSGKGAGRVVAHEIHHLGLRIIQQTRPGTFKRIQSWYGRETENGGDPSLSIEEMYASAMAKEEMGRKTSLPRGVVQTAKKVFRDRHSRKYIDTIIDIVGEPDAQERTHPVRRGKGPRWQSDFPNPIC